MEVLSQRKGAEQGGLAVGESDGADATRWVDMIVSSDDGDGRASRVQWEQG